MGFDIFYDQIRMRLESQGWGAPDDKVYDYVINNLGNNKKPFFFYIITMSSHEPFKNVYNYFSTNRFSDVTPEKMKDYFTTISYVDKTLSRYINQVRVKYPNTYIYIFGDHAPYVLYHKTPFNIALTDIDKQVIQFVPMIIITPDHKMMQETRYAATFLDIAPTIILNSNLNYSYQILGDNLLQQLGNNDIYYKGKQYKRDLLFQMAQKTKSPTYGNN
jgi:phosphoglycerol transferase MdoB-like AlkP superfamily enzyme